MPNTPVRASDLEKYLRYAISKWLKVVWELKGARARLPRSKKKGVPFLPNVEVTLVGAARMKAVNSKYRKKNATTDILSFPAPLIFQEAGYLGELLICKPVVLKQAKQQKHHWKKELDVLLVHGLLHLMHFDHEASTKEQLLMQRFERLALKKPAGLIKRTLNSDLK